MSAVGEEREGTDSGPAPWLYLFGTVAWTWIFLAPALQTGNGLFDLSNVLRELAADASPFAEVGVEAAMTAAVVALSWRWMKRSVG